MGRIAIETEIWESVPGEPNKVRYVDQRSSQEVFDELEAYLSKKGLLPDEYFLLDRNLEYVKFPKGYIVCHADYGGSEGIYLDITVHDKNSIKHFATGKTLYESDEAMNRMAQVACECTKVLQGQGTNEQLFNHTLSKDDHNLILESLNNLREYLMTCNDFAEPSIQAIDKLVEKLADHSGTLLPENYIEADDEIELE